MNPTLKISIGDIVEWESQSGGHYGKIKRGLVWQRVPVGKTPEIDGTGFRTLGAGFGGPRKHESFVVAVGNVAYWPRVKHLRVISKEAT